MSRLADMTRRAHADLVTETQKEATKAFQQELPRARDFTCAQAPILGRRLEKFNEARAQLKMRLGQVNGRLNFQLSHGGDVDQLVAAQDNLMRAVQR